MESIWALSPQAADRLYVIAIAVLCVGALLTLASLLALLSAIAGQAKYVKLQIALAEARTREAQASIEGAQAEQARLQAAIAAPPISPAVAAPEPPPRVLGDAERATLAQHLGERLPAMQYKLAIAAADDPAARSFGLQLMDFFEDEGVALVAQRNPREPYVSRDHAAAGTDILVKYRSSTVPEFAGQMREALAAAGFAAELRQDRSLNLEEVQIVILAG